MNNANGANDTPFFVLPILKLCYVKISLTFGFWTKIKADIFLHKHYKHFITSMFIIIFKFYNYIQKHLYLTKLFLQNCSICNINNKVQNDCRRNVKFVVKATKTLISDFHN